MAKVNSKANEPTEVQAARAQAKEIAKSVGIKYTQALNAVALAKGFKTWEAFHAFSYCMSVYEYRQAKLEGRI